MFTKEVQNPEDFGVVEILDNKVISIIEKPSEPKSNLIAVGLYLFLTIVLIKLEKFNHLTGENMRSHLY